MWKLWSFFQFLTSHIHKIYNFQRKQISDFNNQQNLLIFVLQNTKIDQSCGARFFLSFPSLSLKNWSNLNKSIFENLEAKISKMKQIQNSGFYKIFVLTKSVREHKNIFIEQYLQELLNSKDENCTYLELYWKSYIF